MLKRKRRRSRNPRPMILNLLVLTAVFFAPMADAAESDLWSNITGPGFIPIGAPFTMTIGYGNNGPDTAVSAYLNADFIPPMGLDVFLDNYFNGDGSMFTTLQDSAAGTDTNGNAPLLFWDNFYCENTFFQLQGDDNPDATPIQPLATGESGSFTYEVTVPMEAPRTGTVEITEPAGLVHAWTLTDPASLWVGLGLATPYNKYASTTCSKLVGTGEEDICQYISDNCWGARISQLDVPIEAQFELVNDGTADPTLGCNAFVNFTPGNIALLRRGICEFGVKGFNAEQAGAVAVFMVNDGRCSDFPNGDDCVTNLGPGDLGGLVSIPMALVSVNDGEPIISAVEGGATVAGSFGTSSTWSASTTSYLADAADTDPDPASATISWTRAVNEIYCTYAIDPAFLEFSPSGGLGIVTVTTGDGCSWSASTVAPWVFLGSGSGSTGSGTLFYQVETNTGPGRTATIEIAGQIHSLSQRPGNGCTYHLTPEYAAVGGFGGPGSLEIITQSGCDWTATTPENWIELTSPIAGTGSATIAYIVDSNGSGPRSGVVVVTDQIHTIDQLARSGCDHGLVADDGTMENGYGWGSGRVFVQQFTPDAYPFTATDVCAAFTQAAGDSDLSYEVLVYDDDGPTGGPGTLLASVPAVASGIPGWPDHTFSSVRIEGEGVTIDDGTIYVGVGWDDTAEIGFYVAADESPSTPVSPGFFSTDGISWATISSVFPDYRSLMVRLDGMTSADGEWEQVVGNVSGGGSGFGRPANTAVRTMATFNGSLYAGTFNTSGGEVNVTGNGIDWSPANQPGWGNSANDAVAKLVSYGGALFASTENPSFGTQIWRMAPNNSWSFIDGGGFDDHSNTSAPSGGVFAGELYFGTDHPDGCEIWKSPNGVFWSQSHTNGLGNPQNRTATAMAVFADELYVGTSNPDGAEIWKTPDGIVWFPVVTGGFTTAANGSIDALEVFDDTLVAGVSNASSGAQLWRSADGAAWSQLVGDGFGNPGATRLDALVVGELGLYTAVSGSTLPGSIRFSPNGTHWQDASSPGFTNSDNTAVRDLHLWADRIYAGTSNPTSGCEVWRGGVHFLFADGFESGDTIDWTVTVP